MTTFEPVSLDDFLLKPWPLGHFSASQAKQAVVCPEQFRRVKILGHLARPNVSREWGSADHETAGFNYSQKISTEKDLPAPELQEHFVNGFEERVEKAGGPDEIDWLDSAGDRKMFADQTPKQCVETVKTKGSGLVTAYREQIAQDLFPETVEEEFLIEPEGLGIPIKGFIDVVARRRDAFTREMSEPMILERKTRGQMGAPKPADLFQARVYQLARPLEAEFHISSRPNARVQTYPSEGMEAPETTVRSLRAILLEIAGYYALYGPDQPWPDHGRQHDWMCGFCSFKATCPWWHKEYWPK